jgi:hypothetical protein
MPLPCKLKNKLATKHAHAAQWNPAPTPRRTRTTPAHSVAVAWCVTTGQAPPFSSGVARKDPSCGIPIHLSKQRSVLLATVEQANSVVLGIYAIMYIECAPPTLWQASLGVRLTGMVAYNVRYGGTRSDGATRTKISRTPSRRGDPVYRTIRTVASK